MDQLDPLVCQRGIERGQRNNAVGRAQQSGQRVEIGEAGGIALWEWRAERQAEVATAFEVRRLKPTAGMMASVAREHEDGAGLPVEMRTAIDVGAFNGMSIAAGCDAAAGA